MYLLNLHQTITTQPLCYSRQISYTCFIIYLPHLILLILKSPFCKRDEMKLNENGCYNENYSEMREIYNFIFNTKPEKHLVRVSTSSECQLCEVVFSINIACAVRRASWDVLHISIIDESSSNFFLFNKYFVLYNRWSGNKRTTENKSLNKQIGTEIVKVLTYLYF